MKTPLFILFSLIVFGKTYSQVNKVVDNKGTIKNIINNTVTEATTAPTIPTPQKADIWLNSTTNTYYVYDGTSWKKLNKEETTYETVALTTGNQVITVANADKIVGFTLISNSNWLHPDSGKMTGTWMIGKNRERIRCSIQILDPPHIKILTVSVKIDNATNEISFTRYSSRYWEITDAIPQTTLTHNQNSYRLGKIVLIRKE
ncbi:hypothetical protein G1L02_05070 [Tenacibaculum finnmarkense]|uniref:hypothetical protein n=1 Tax=Tenacibaculum finnmarkense TaxID=2781243 RepID=UPI001E2CA23E|nr:hypothetical protein [Tenacibaculum finnmarkense]MCD8410329.1 hypothetical protein [Tenacibaculum finnmarkense genomovar ulcerans]MCG8762894.1 hypothetical protein [Tenacibaculum finnmarkense]MCG8788271.1 hypothetical protein [Tenacibaculum finnmarkense]MCG8803252.1 hypothetical protein [Tenacibaculum finnmarkense]MCG8826067.1 hypothetical protein [Tenacibaculum finnmarkense]